eukprot:GFUD01121704.1.p1 GENE.GFUD01121704.1~~GFUD01121704.1.p1  ORF type:complete len:316 (+),score=78.46 GFUD01121704.1:62-1009(+)
MGSEKFCLRWNDFEGNISSAFRELKDDKDFFDVTLACEEEQIQAHRVILSACSPFFHQVLRKNPHQYPLLYLKGVTFTDLQSVLNFMYHGEVSVAQEELNSFLAVAEDLMVKGLTQGQPTGYGTKKSYPPSPTSPPPKPAPQPPDRIPFHPRKHIQPPAPPTNPQSTNNLVAYDEEEIQEVTPVKPEPEFTPPIHQEPFPSHPPPSLPPPSTMQDSYEEDEEYEENILQAAEVVPEHVEGMQPSDLLQYTRKDLTTGKHVCTLCSNFSHTYQANVRNHIESKHFPGTFVYTCQLCGKQSPSHQGLLKHKSKWHKK